MKKAITLLLLASVIFANPSCSTRKTASRSLFVEEKRVTSLTPVFLPPDTALLRAQLECDSLGKVYIKHLTSLSGRNKELSARLDFVGMLCAETVIRRDTIYIPSTTCSYVRHDTLTVYRPVAVGSGAEKGGARRFRRTARAVAGLVIASGIIYVAILLFRKRKTFINL